MENDVDELVTLPFQQLLDTAKSALDNVGDSRDIEVLAQSLVKDIERGMGKIGPICKRNLDQYGQNFLDALRENGEQNSGLPVECGSGSMANNAKTSSRTSAKS